MESLERLGVLELRALLTAGEVSPLEVVGAAVARIEDHDSGLNSFVELRERAFDEARACDVHSGPLAGVPVAIKDMFVDEDRHPTMGSRLRGPHLTGTAEAVARLRRAGAIVVGYTNLHEWGLGMSSTPTATGPVRNPWDLERATGGSSGGSAAAVAAGFVPAAIGTDAGGSIRCPAACCGVIGFKPSWDRVPMAGFIEGPHPPLDHAGPIARNVADIRALFEVLIDGDLWAETVDPSTLRVGIARQHFFDDLDPRVFRGLREGVGALEPLVKELRTVEVPRAEAASYAVGLLLLPYTAELLEEELAAGKIAELQPELQKVVALGRALQHERSCGRWHHRTIMESRRRLPTSTLLDFPKLPKPIKNLVGKHWINREQGEFARRAVTESFEKAFKEVDVIITPSVPVLPPPLIADGRVNLPSGPVSTDTAYLPIFGPMNLSGIPTISLPCAETDDGWAVSMQISAAKGRDGVVLALAEAFEKATDHVYADRVAPLDGEGPAA